MHLEGKIEVQAKKIDVFNRLNDVNFFASCIEGVTNLQEIEKNKYTATFETKVAYIRIKFEIFVEISQSIPPDKIVAKSEGKPMGIVGRLTATSTANLSEANGITQIDYSIDLALTGKLGSLGQPVIRSKTKELEHQFAKNINLAFQPKEVN
jgi:carbon monoxide dehydrogenase subunit G